MKRAENMPKAPVNIMDQYHPDNFCDPGNPKYQVRYAELARRPSGGEMRAAFGYAHDLGLNFESISYEKNVMGLWQ